MDDYKKIKNSGGNFTSVPSPKASDFFFKNPTNK